MLLGSSIIAMQLQISGARTFHASCVNRLQSSYYAESVVKSCVEEAGARDYKLTVEPVAVYKGRESKLITLEYHVAFPFILNHSITGTVAAYGK